MSEDAVSEDAVSEDAVSADLSSEDMGVGVLSASAFRINALS